MKNLYTSLIAISGHNAVMTCDPSETANAVKAKGQGRCGERGEMRTELPPAGPAMAFPQWAAAIVAGVRRYLPNVRAVRKRSRLVILRYGDREAHLKNDGSFWITYPSSTVANTLASMYDDRRDWFTVGNLAGSIAGHFDVRFTRADT